MGAPIIGAIGMGDSEEQVAKVIAETIRRRESEQTQLMSLMSERAQSNPLIFRVNRAIREAWESQSRRRASERATW